MPILHHLSLPFLAQYHRWILWLPFFIAAGAGFYFSLDHEPSMAFAILPTIITAALLVVFSKREYLRLFLIPLFCLSLGFGAGILRSHTAGTYIMPDETRAIYISGRVDLIEQDISSNRILLDRVSLENIAPNETPRKIRLKLAGKFGVPDVGDRITIRGVLMPPPPPVAPRSYDFQRHMFFQGIGATGYAVAGFEVIEKSSTKIPGSETQRENIKDYIKMAGGSDQAKSILIALMTGERRQIHDDLWEDIRKSGIAHLLAISGLHIGLVAGIIFFIVRLLLVAIPYTAVYWPVKKISALAAFAAIVYYGWLVGSPVSADRAIIMTGIVLFAILIDRVAISLRLAACAAAFIILISPEMIFTPGFQMSFSAVICLIAFYERWQHRFSSYFYGRGIFTKLSGYFLATLVTTIIATLATAPFALYHFQRVALLPGLLANMAAVPMTAFIVMPLSLLSMVLMPFNLSGVILPHVLQSIDVILEIANYTANMPHSTWSWHIWPQSALIVMVIGMLWFIIWQGKLRLFGLMPIILSLWMIKHVQLPDIRIDDEGKLMAIHMGEGVLAFSEKRAARFAREIYETEYGSRDPVYWSQEGKIDDLNCDAGGCVLKKHDFKIGFPHSQMSSYLDCEMADLVIAPQFYSLPKICDSKTVIKRSDIKRTGAQAIYIKDNDIRIETARDVRGTRRWTNYPDQY